MIVRRIQNLYRAGNKYQCFAGVDDRLRCRTIIPAPIMGAVIAIAFHAGRCQQIDRRCGTADAFGLPGGNARQLVERIIQRDQGIAAAHRQQQRRAAPADGHALQGGPAIIIAGTLGAIAHVDDGGIGIKNSQHAAAADPFQLQDHAAGIRHIKRPGSIRIGVHHAHGSAQLAVPRGHRCRGKAVVIRGKRQCNGGAVGAGQLPGKGVPAERSIVHHHFRRIAVRLRHHGQGAVLRHFAQHNGVIKAFGVQLAGAALHRQLLACAVIQHKAGVAHGQRRAGIARLDGADLCAVSGIDRHILIIHLHKTARQGFHLGRRADAGVGGPTRPGAVEIQRDRICHIPQHGNGCTQQATAHRHNGGNNQHHQNNGNAPAALAAAQNRADGPQRCRRCRSCALLFGRQGAGCAALRRWAFPFRLLFGGRRRGWRGFAPFPRQHTAAAFQPLFFFTVQGLRLLPVLLCYSFRAIPHNSKCRYGERGAAAARPKAQIILDVLSSILATQMPCRSRRSGA